MTISEGIAGASTPSAVAAGIGRLRLPRRCAPRNDIRVAGRVMASDLQNRTAGGILKAEGFGDGSSV